MSSIWSGSITHKGRQVADVSIVTGSPLPHSTLLPPTIELDRKLGLASMTDCLDQTVLSGLEWAKLGVASSHVIQSGVVRVTRMHSDKWAAFVKFLAREKSCTFCSIDTDCCLFFVPVPLLKHNAPILRQHVMGLLGSEEADSHLVMLMYLKSSRRRPVKMTESHPKPLQTTHHSNVGIKREPQERTVKQEPQEGTVKQEPQERTVKQEPQERTVKQEPQERTVKQESKCDVSAQSSEKHPCTNPAQHTGVTHETQDSTAQKPGIPKCASSETKKMEHDIKTESDVQNIKGEAEEQSAQKPGILTCEEARGKQHDIELESEERKSVADKGSEVESQIETSRTTKVAQQTSPVQSHSLQSTKNVKTGSGKDKESSVKHKSILRITESSNILEMNNNAVVGSPELNLESSPYKLKRITCKTLSLEGYREKQKRKLALGQIQLQENYVVQRVEVSQSEMMQVQDGGSDQSELGTNKEIIGHGCEKKKEGIDLEECGKNKENIDLKESSDATQRKDCDPITSTMAEEGQLSEEEDGGEESEHEEESEKGEEGDDASFLGQCDLDLEERIAEWFTDSGGEPHNKHHSESAKLSDTEISEQGQKQSPSRKLITSIQESIKSDTEISEQGQKQSPSRKLITSIQESIKSDTEICEQGQKQSPSRQLITSIQESIKASEMTIDTKAIASQLSEVTQSASHVSCMELDRESAELKKQQEHMIRAREAWRALENMIREDDAVTDNQPSTKPNERLEEDIKAKALMRLQDMLVEGHHVEAKEALRKLETLLQDDQDIEAKGALSKLKSMLREDHHDTDMEPMTESEETNYEDSDEIEEDSETERDISLLHPKHRSIKHSDVRKKSKSKSKDKPSKDNQREVMKSSITRQNLDDRKQSELDNASKYELYDPFMNESEMPSKWESGKASKYESDRSSKYESDSSSKYESTTLSNDESDNPSKYDRCKVMKSWVARQHSEDSKRFQSYGDRMHELSLKRKLQADTKTTPEFFKGFRSFRSKRLRSTSPGDSSCSPAKSSTRFEAKPTRSSRTLSEDKMSVRRRSKSPISRSRKSRSPISRSRKSRSPVPSLPMSKFGLAYSMSLAAKASLSRTLSDEKSSVRRRSRSPISRSRKSRSPISRSRKSRSPISRSRKSRSPISRSRKSRSPISRSHKSRSPISSLPLTKFGIAYSKSLGAKATGPSRTLTEEKSSVWKRLGLPVRSSPPSPKSEITLTRSAAKATSLSRRLSEDESSKRQRLRSRSPVPSLSLKSELTSSMRPAAKPTHSNYIRSVRQRSRSPVSSSPSSSKSGSASSSSLGQRGQKMLKEQSDTDCKLVDMSISDLDSANEFGAVRTQAVDVTKNKLDEKSEMQCVSVAHYVNPPADTNMQAPSSFAANMFVPHATFASHMPGPIAYPQNMATPSMIPQNYVVPVAYPATMYRPNVLTPVMLRGSMFPINNFGANAAPNFQGPGLDLNLRNQTTLGANNLGQTSYMHGSGVNFRPGRPGSNASNLKKLA